MYRGKQLHVEDALEACFTNAWRKGVHMTMEMTFSKGCPGYSEADNLFFEDDNPVNRDKIKDIHFPVNCKISLYPMGIPDYMKYIATVLTYSHGQAHGNLTMVTTAASRRMSYTVSGPRDPSGLAL